MAELPDDPARDQARLKAALRTAETLSRHVRESTLPPIVVVESKISPIILLVLAVVATLAIVDTILAVTLVLR